MKMIMGNEIRRVSSVFESYAIMELGLFMLPEGYRDIPNYFPLAKFHVISHDMLNFYV